MMELIKTILSWTHTISASLSLVFGIIVLLGVKGNIRHKKIGLWYFYAMLFNNITALFILNAFGKWFFPHYLAIACLIVIIPGIISIKLKHKYWHKVHIICMVLSFYLLIGGAINETFLHIPNLRPYLVNNDPVVGITYMFAQLFFNGVLSLEI
ncbi:MAG: DUF2306 domain-containing protein [Alphaproteobacteria bacterium]|nr:DUF2306 domain-containing protein [Alphaproteobacteria bacterium]